jgi:DNA-binding transcriptional MerR regulator
MTAVRRLEAVESTNQLTIEQLAAETGLSVRNIRSHQARGLLAPPEVRMRVGYYGPEHVAQLRLIRELQDEGFNLGGIKRLLDDTQGTAARLLRVRRSLAAQSSEQPAEILTAVELGRRFALGQAEGRQLLARAIELGVLVPLGDDRYQAPNPSLLAVAEEAVRSGIPLTAALEVVAELERHCESVSRALVRLFVREVWKPFAQADMPAERWPQIEEAIERLRPAAVEALMAIFQRALSRQLEDAFREIARRLAERKR